MAMAPHGKVHKRTFLRHNGTHWTETIGKVALQLFNLDCVIKLMKTVPCISCSTQIWVILKITMTSLNAAYERNDRYAIYTNKKRFIKLVPVTFENITMGSQLNKLPYYDVQWGYKQDDLVINARLVRFQITKMELQKYCANNCRLVLEKLSMMKLIRTFEKKNYKLKKSRITQHKIPQLRVCTFHPLWLLCFPINKMKIITNGHSHTNTS